MTKQQDILELDGTYNRILQNEREMVHANLIPVMFPFVIVPDGWYAFSIVTDTEERNRLPKTIKVYVYPSSGTRYREAYLCTSELDVMHLATILKMTKFTVFNTTDLRIRIAKRRVYVR